MGECLLVIVAHRGRWDSGHAQNSIAAHLSAGEAGWGTEVDIRDSRDHIDLRHDPFDGSSGGSFCKLVERWSDARYVTPMAVNLKACGLMERASEKLRSNGIQHYFFDLPGPEMVIAQRTGLPFLIRRSPYERGRDFEDHAAGTVWDSFGSDGFWGEKLDLWPQKFNLVISDEIHGLDPQKQWRVLREWVRNRPQDEVHLCTDRPLAAQEYFRALD